MEKWKSWFWCSTCQTRQEHEEMPKGVWYCKTCGEVASNKFIKASLAIRKFGIKYEEKRKK